MSFHVEFVAENRTVAAAEIAGERSLPASVVTFVLRALEAIPETHGVYVLAKGHLFEKPGDYDVSTCDIKVYRVRRA